MSDRPDLAALLADLEAGVRELEPAEAPAVVTRLGAILATAGARLAAATAPSASNGNPRDCLLTAQDVHALTTMSVDWLYRHADALPFARRVGRKVLFSEAGLTKWLSTRRCS